VAAALVSASPVSRDDACLYTTPTAAAAPSTTDQRLTQALARDLSADDTIKLLEGRAVASPPSATRQGTVASPAPSHPGGDRLVAPDVDAGPSGWQAASAALSQRYGYPGAGAELVDVSPLTPEVRERAAAAGAGVRSGRSGSGGSVEQYRASVVRRAQRRSSSAAPPKEGDEEEGR
jgi:hypothetical protein